MHAWHIRPGKKPDELPVMILDIYKIQLFDIKDQDRVGELAFEIIEVAVLDLLKIFQWDILFIVSASHFDLFEEFLRWAVEVDEDIRIWEITVENLKEMLEQPVFFVIQVFAREEYGLPEEIIRNHKFIEQRTRVQAVLQLFVPFGHEEQLDRKSIPFRIFVKRRQEWVVRKLL